MAHSTNLVGQVVDQYQISRHIARGGMADVYLAEDVDLGRQVVLKVMLPMLAQDAEFVARFRREAQTTARLNHPNIVQVYRTGSVPNTGQPYLAMQYIQGGTLQQTLLTLLQRDQILQTTTALSLIRQMADALDVAHRAGIVHRDLKPSNILLHPNGTPVLTDLGIAAVSTESRLTRTGDVMGTPHYMSPEQASGRSLDGRSDLYSLGIILYELLAGMVPFQGDSPLAVLHQHVYEAPPPLQRIRPDLAPVTLQVVDRCLAKDPFQRFQSAGEMAAALSTALTEEGRSQPVGADPVSGKTQFDPVLNHTITRKSVVHTLTAVPQKRRVPPWLYAAGAVVLLAVVGWLALQAFNGGDGAETAQVADVRATETAVTGNEATSTIAAVQPDASLPTLTPLPTTQTTATSDFTETPPATETAVPAVEQNRQIVFQSNRDGDFEIYLMEENGNNQRPLTSNDDADELPKASPDGAQIAFQSDRDGNFEVYVMNVDGSNQRRLTNTPSSERLPTWSPDGTQIAFLSDRTGNYEIFIMNADGSGVRQVTNSGARAGHMSWSVNDELVYNSGTEDGSTWELYVTDIFGSFTRQLTDNAKSDWSPEWSPDGRTILYLSIATGRDPGVYLMNADGSNPRLIFNSSDYEWGADWTADGRILFTREQANSSYIYVMDANGGNVTLISDRGSYPDWVP